MTLRAFTRVHRRISGRAAESRRFGCGRASLALIATAFAVLALAVVPACGSAATFAREPGVAVARVLRSAPRKLSTFRIALLATVGPGAARSGGGEDFYEPPVRQFRKLSQSYANKMAEAAGYPCGAEEWKESVGADAGADIYVDADGNFFVGNKNPALVPGPDERAYLDYANGSATVPNEQPMTTEMGLPA